jgi:hypothetical protein
LGVDDSSAIVPPSHAAVVLFLSFPVTFPLPLAMLGFWRLSRRRTLLLRGLDRNRWSRSERKRVRFRSHIGDVRKRKKCGDTSFGGSGSFLRLKQFGQFFAFEPKAELLNANQLETSWLLIFEQSRDANENPFIEVMGKSYHMKSWR